MNANARLDAALRYAARGWPVFPCHQPVAGACSCGQHDCGSPGKHPRTRHGLHDATTDPEQIRRWWHTHTHANIGIRTGGPSGLIVIDLDLPHGPDQFKQLAQGRLEELAAVRTGSGGLHLYFQALNHTVIRNSAGRLGPGIDIRGDGGYILAPPSRHYTGDAYTWQTATEIPPLPRWLQNQLEPPTRPSVSRPRPVHSGSDWAIAVRDEEVSNVAAAPEGTRNVTLNRAAFVLGRLAARGELDPADVRARLEDAAAAAGLPLREVQRTIDSGLSAGLDVSHGIHR